MTSIRILPDVLYRSLGGETVLMNLESGATFTLDRWGHRVWELIGELGDLDGVELALRAEFDVDPEILSRDLAAFLAELESERLVDLVDADR